MASAYLKAKAVTKSNATPGELRRALEALMLDITSGKLSGRNPWSLDSMKAASETLTGGNWADLSSADLQPRNKEAL